jgi:hypothetical protein
MALPKRRPDAAEQVAVYCGEHPRSPSAVRRPRVILRGHVWIALIGESVQRGIAGFGPTIQAALSAFDRQYLNALRPPVERRKASPARTRRKLHGRQEMRGSAERPWPSFSRGAAEPG